MQRLLADMALCLWISGCLLAPLAEGFEVQTHEVVNESAVKRSSLGALLNSQLGLADGIEHRIAGGRTVERWISLAGKWEDDGLRFLNHFHDPLKAWSKAGLGGLSSASVIWAQSAEGNNWSWPRARSFFYQALTAASPADRDAALADTFRSVGQVMHLVVDLAVPAHARNDPHPLAYTLESWLLAVSLLEPARFTEFLQATIGPDPDVISFGPNPEAPIPIARLWDTDQFTGENPEITAGTGAGLAEYTNANFLSEDTRFTGYLFPNRESVRPEDFTIPDPREPSGTATRQYHVKWQHGDAGYRLATVGFLRDYYSHYLPERLGEVAEGLDDHVYSDYSRRLLPRAVGYARAVLEYFSRGRLQPSFAPGLSGSRELILRTRKLGNEPIGPGTLSLLYDDSDGTRRRIRELPVPDLGGGSELPPIQFDIPAEPPLQYVVVYRGRLGLEADAVVGRVFGGVPIVAVQELAALTGEEVIRGGSTQQARQKNPNHQRAAGSFWADGSAGVGKKIREVRLEEGRGHDGLFPPKAVLRINGKEVGTEWRAADDGELLPERWEVVLSPIPGETIDTIVVPPPAIWVNDFRTPLLWIQHVLSATDQVSFLGPDGVRIWRTRKVQATTFHFGDGTGVTAAFSGLDANFVIRLDIPQTRVSFRPMGEVVTLAVPQGEVEVSPESCSFYRIRFIFGWRRTNVGFGGCEIGSDVFWAKNFLNIDEAVKTVGDQPDPSAPPLLTAATFRRDFLDADLQRFLGVGVAPPQYEIQTQ